MPLNIVSFNTKDGLELYCGLHTPKKITKNSRTAIIHIHGMTDHFFEGNTMTVGRHLAETAGYGFLSFNNRGAELISTINHKYYGTSLEKFEECLYDIDAAIAFMKKQGFRKIILSGHSTGCQKSVYYQVKRKRPEVKALILLAPADDVNYQKKLLGKKFAVSVKKAHEMIKKGLGDYPVPKKFGTPYFSARRYYLLYSGKSIEGHIFNYDEDLSLMKKITIPFFAAFGSQEQYVVKDPKIMLEQIAKVARHQKSKTALIKDADHSFHGQEKQLAHELRKFFTIL